jgi:hypothetical protein
LIIVPDHVDSGVRCTPFNPTNLKKKDFNTELKTSEPVASVMDLQAGGNYYFYLIELSAQLFRQ